MQSALHSVSRVSVIRIFYIVLRWFERGSKITSDVCQGSIEMPVAPIALLCRP